MKKPNCSIQTLTFPAAKIADEYYSLQLHHFNGLITNLDCFKLALFFRSCVDSYRTKIKYSKLNKKESFKNNDYYSGKTFNPYYNELARLMKYVFDEDVSQLEPDEIDFNPSAITTRKMIDCYKNFNTTNDLGVKCVKTTGAISMLCKANEFTEYLLQYKAEDNRYFFINRDLIKHASSVSELFIFALLSSSKPQQSKTWNLQTLLTVINDMVAKGKIKGSFGRYTVTHAFNKYNAYYNIKLVVNNVATGG